MHYCCLVITKEFPTETVLENVLKPFNSEDYYSQPEETRVRPAFTWDWWKVGGRYEGMFKLKIEENSEKYRWNFYERNPRNGRLFRSMLLDKMAEWAKNIRFSFFREEEWFGTMGSWDGFIRVDGAFCDDITNLQDASCYCFVDQNGNAFARDYYNEEELVTNQEFDTQLSNAKENCSGCYICVVDLHD